MSITQLGLTGTPSKQYSVSPKRAATTVTKSIGTSSRDYSTMTAWEADLDNTLVYVSGDDAVGECYNDSVFDEQVTIDGGVSVGLETISLTSATGEEHDGTAGTGVRNVRSGSGEIGSLITTSSALKVETFSINKIELDGNETSIRQILSCAGGTSKTSANREINSSRMIVHGSSSAAVIAGLSLGGKNSKSYNNIVYRVERSNTSGNVYGLYDSNDQLSNYIYNNTVYNVTGLCTARVVGIRWNWSTGSHESKNNISTNVTGVNASILACFDGNTGFDITNNLSSDTSATGTGSITNAVTADQFVSTVGGSEDLHLKSGSDAIGAGVDLGTTPDGVQYDIDGVDRDARGTTWDIGADQAAGPVTKTIGTTARDYSTITLWEADLDLSTVYQSGDDAVGECYNDSTFDESVTINGGTTVGLNSCTLTVANGEKHDGTAGNGVRIVRTANSSNIISNTGSTQTEISWLEIDANGFNATGMCRGETDSVTSSRLKNLIAHGQSGPSSFNGFLLNRGSSYCLNNILYDCINTLSSGGGNGFKSGSSAENWHNNTCYLVKSGVSHTSGSFYGMSFASITASNNISVDSGTDGTATGADFTGTSDYSLSSDSSASGTSVLTNKTSTNQFVSIVSGSEDLHLKSGSDAIGAGVDLGTTPDGVQYDIDGFDRDAANRVWDIGADQAAATITKTIGTTARDYSTMTLWEADLDDTTIYQSGDDAVGECYNDSTFTSGADITIIRTDLSSMTLKAADGEGHDGTSGTGVVINSTAPNHIRYRDAHVPLIVERIELAGSTIAIRTNRLATYKRMLIYNSSSTFATEGGQEPATLMNSIIYTATTGPNCLGHKNYNNTIYNMTNDGVSGAIAANGGEVKNTISVGNGGEDFDTGTAQTESYCMSSDTTASGTGSITSVVTADQFVSIVSGSEDLHLKSGSDAIGAGVDLGTTPTGVEIDIDGRDRDAEGDTWSIGADQFVEILHRHFFTRLGLRATPQAYWFWEGSRTVSEEEEEEETTKGKSFFIFFY